MTVLISSDVRIPSNRGERQEESVLEQRTDCMPADGGVDYLGLKCVARKPDYSSGDWILNQYGPLGGIPTVRGRMHVDVCGCAVEICSYSGGESSATCFVHFNPARFIDPWGIGLCRPSDLKMVIEEVVDGLRDYITILTDFEDLQIRRLDVARNFYCVSNPSKILRALHCVPKRHSTFTDLHSGPDGVCETLTSGSKSGGQGKLYDKFRESPGRCDPGTMRFEVQARQPWCERNGLLTLSTITPISVDKLLRDRAKWFGLESDVMTVQTAFEIILDLADSELGTRKKLGLMQFIHARARGELPKMSSRTAAEYRGLLREFGIAPTLEVNPDPSITRLDLRSGTEVKVA
jgi:hypothetical protein